MRFMVEYVYVMKTAEEAKKTETRCFMELAVFNCISTESAEDTARATAPLVLTAHCLRFLGREPQDDLDDWEATVAPLIEWNDRREQTGDEIIRICHEASIFPPARLSEFATGLTPDLSHTGMYREE